ncbi:hypothetical protein FQN60_007360 [Etheostoma spectabile]|uniref:SV2A/B/C luminal domain-containing protein n=1 Tax=Etheostoma spectabile TaxID=54343 RepID=A0A5J5D2M7_9PERO|nr:hypothetical protein FQN60_007360 [Etheostoma spectabile]
MEDGYQNRTAFIKGAKDIAKEVKRQASKKVGRSVDRVSDQYSKRSYNRFEEDDDDDYPTQGSQDGGYYRGDSQAANDDEGGHSDSTEGHDEDDEIYEGEYQGIPRAESGKASLAGGPGSVTAGAQQFTDIGVSEAERRKDQEELAQQYETILQECGHGKFQWSLYFVLGLALMADGVEIFVVGFVLPSAEKDMCLSEPNKSMLGLIVYFGMMVGAFLWGALADRIGRRQIGGSIPIVFSYYSEFLSQEKRGEHLSWLCMFWMIGGIYASAMAWAIIPHYGWSFQMGSAYQFHSWRVFVLVCAFPSVAAIASLSAMPESPRFYLENGKHDEGWMILKQVHDTNMRAKGHPEKVFSVTTIKTVKQMDELVDTGTDTPVLKRYRLKIMSLSQQIRNNIVACFNPEYKRTTFMLMAVWFTMSFSYYGLTVWFPDMIKYIQKQEYESRTKTFSGERVEHITFNFTLENQIHLEGHYFNDKFLNLKMKSMVFENSVFEECYFEDITSTHTIFRNCTFVASLFYNTDLFKYRMVNCKLVNSTFLHNKEGCMLDFSDDFNNAYMIYFVNFLGTLAVLPGNIVSALLMDKIGRLRMLAGSSVISCVSCFFLMFGNSESGMIALLCLFGGISIASWNALDVITVELYPSDKRTTAFGFLNALCKLAAVLGISIFQSFVGITKAVPILFAAGALAAGSFLATKLPETRGLVLQ